MTSRPRASSDDSWDNLTHSQVTDATSTSHAATQPTKEQFLAVQALRQKFKDSRSVHATVPLHLGTLTPEQILEINFLAGAIVSKNPNMAADKLVADLAGIYQSKDKDQIESQLATLMKGEAVAKKEEFVALDKGQNDPQS